MKAVSRLHLVAMMIVVLGGMLLFSIPARAASTDVLGDVCSQNPEASACQGNRTQTPENNSIFGPNSLLATVTQLLALVIGIASVIVIIIGGLQYILAGGDPARVNSAKNTILYAIIGVVIAVTAQIIINFVIRRL